MTSKDTNSFLVKKTPALLSRLCPKRSDCLPPPGVSAAPLSVLLLRYLFPFLYIGLGWPMGLRVSPELPNFYYILGGKRFSLAVKQDDISTDFCLVFDFGVCSAFYVSPFAIPHPLLTIE